MKLSGESWSPDTVSDTVMLGDTRVVRVEHQFIEQRYGQLQPVAAKITKYETGVVTWTFGIHTRDLENGDRFVPKEPEDMAPWEMAELGNVAREVQERLDVLGCRVDFSQGITGTGMAIMPRTTARIH